MSNKRKHICIGLLAHVDAGKTTLSEAILYKSGAIRNFGRVDHKNAFLDTDVNERERGITIFSKQARFSADNADFTLLDTPGHVDFSAEMERCLQVLDYAVLIISGKDGVQGHTVTLWRLFEKYNLPVFIFVNKMDMDGADRNSVVDDLRKNLSENCIGFDEEGSEEWLDDMSMCDELLLNEFIENGKFNSSSIAMSIKKRNVFPCFFGSALKLEGVETFLKGLTSYTLEKNCGGEFGAKVYKITRDKQGNRLTHIRITGGSLSVKEVVGSEKIEQIRVYSGEKFETVEHIRAGQVCAVTGLKESYAGQGLGFEKDSMSPALQSVLVYNVILPAGEDVHGSLIKLKQLEEEDPQLHIIWNEQLQVIQLQLMGEVQIEVLKKVVADRFGIDVEFGSGSIAYKETIENIVAGAGHFEPLRHYAEVHLLMETGARGSGLVFETACSEDLLDKNWQRLIITHLAEKEHCGVLTASPITDMKITLLAGRAHLKHTEGGDFRQATYRAIRQGLRKAKSLLLEPWYEYRLEIPTDNVGRAMADIQRMGGSFEEPIGRENTVILNGKAPVSTMKDYALEVISYTKGYGNLTCSLSGYDICHNSEEVIEAIGYDPDKDSENTGDSVFCSHGAGVNIKWYESDEMMHVQPRFEKKQNETTVQSAGLQVRKASEYTGTREEDEELDRIFEMTYGKPKKRAFAPAREIQPIEKVKIAPTKVLEEYLLVDGYNIIFAWNQLKELAEINMDSARESLIEILANYQGYKKCHVIAVFDAYKVKGGERKYEKHNGIDVVYTAEAETADMYIEKTAHKKSKDYLVRVATSDRLEQLIVMGEGAFKVSAEEFRLEVEKTSLEIRQIMDEIARKNKLNNRRGIDIPK